MKTSAIILAAGKGQRMNLEINKLLVRYNEQTVLEKTLGVFLYSDKIDNIVLVVSEEDKDEISTIIENYTQKPISIVVGGQTRTDSVKNGLSSLMDENPEIVLIHDGARPFVTDEIISSCVNSTMVFGSGICAVQAVDTMAFSTSDQRITSFIDRDKLFHLQTPQGFRFYEITKAYSRILPTDTFTDDSGVFAKYFSLPHLCKGDIMNKKITYVDDLKFLNNQMSTKIGNGYDFHIFSENRKFVLGGIEIPHSLGLLGHSDADVLIHAIMDALLNAINEKDIGNQFPDTDNNYKDISSLVLLEKVNELLWKKHITINNISAVVICEKPKISAYIDKMANKIASTLGINENQISISATTTEKMGAIGRGEGIAVNAVCLVSKNNS